MNYPNFYNSVETITMYDPLSEVLGSFEEGIVEFNYLNSVQSAGHSCPTVAGAYLMTLKALKALYPDTLPVRGEIKVAFASASDEGVTGVIGNVISNITGATETTGFKGLGGKFARHSLMDFNAKINASARFTRVDTGASVDVVYDPSSIAGDGDPSQMQMMMGRAIAGEKESRKKFGIMWQRRVEKILLDNSDNENVIKVIAL
ncbi:MAG: hypothetical protein U9P71_01825 [Campylobacterota bacterium]|nr:hypothetical protein [Campylobacterota bacterium]